MSYLSILLGWDDRVYLALIFIAVLLAERNNRNRKFAERNGCEKSHRRAHVRDPFLGLDFVYDHLWRGSPERTLADATEDFRRLGSTYTVNRWTSQAIHTSDHRNIKHLLAVDFRNFELPRVRVAVMQSLLGPGIFTLNGEAWSHARGILKPCLAKQRMESLPALLERHVEAFVRQLPCSSAAVDLQPLFFGIAMDVATDFLMGHSTDMLINLRKGGRDQDFMDDYMLCSTEAVKMMRLGPLHFLRRSRRAERAKARMFQYVDDYIEESLSRQALDGSSRQPSVLVELARIIEDRKALRDQVLHILLASRDTTASLLSNLFFMLARKPQTYAKLREQVLRIAGKTCPTADQLKEMEYLRWCIYESLRLHPVIPSNAREATADTTLPLGGGKDGSSPLFVRKGTVVLYNVYAMHRNSEIFGAHVEDFIPERWKGLRPGWSYLPFNGGPRVCIGQQFALLEAYYIVARLVQTIREMEPRDDREWMELTALAMTCKNGVHVSLKCEAEDGGGERCD